jgi:formylmethanofuran dehydrogenase subunit B
MRELTDILGALRLILQGGVPEHSRQMPRRRLTALENLAQTLRKARYGVFVWAPGQFPPNHGELIVRDIVDIVVHLNETTRFSGLSLGGNDGGMSFQNVCTWQTGFPPPVCFPDGTVVYDPGLYQFKSMAESGTADALLWLSCFGPSRPSHASEIPTILVGRAARRHVVDVEVYLPAGVPGVDHDGNLFRTDSVVSLPLRTLRSSDNLPGAEVLDRIRRRI